MTPSTTWSRKRGSGTNAVPPGLRPTLPAPSALVPPAEPSPLHEAILAWLDAQS